ncbi:MAG: DUF92 domain-containing protein [Ignavibacteriales bacterium]|nr:DUF92 domain-containing protein [Ignavibacteriales bacterium]
MGSDLWEQPPEIEWWIAAGLATALAGLLGIADLIRKWFSLSPEFPRKFVHITAALLIVTTLDLFTRPLPLIALGAVFASINALSMRTGFLKGIHLTQRRSYGTVLYPLTFGILVILFWYSKPAIIVMSMLVLAFGDSAAAIVGQYQRHATVYHWSSDEKSVEGSMAMFLVSFLVLFAGLTQILDVNRIPLEFVLACAGVAAATGTAWEALSSRGFDNLTAPLSVAFVLSCFLLPNARTDIQQLTIGAALGIMVAVASHRMAMLSASGAVATFLLSIVVFGLGGWKFTLPLVTFFVLSSLLSKAGADRKARFVDMLDKAGARDHSQVFANGGIAATLVLLGYWFPEWDPYPAYLGAVAAVTADTWGTELGILGRWRTVLFPSFKPVPPGTNGGVSIVGVGAGAVGSLVIALSAFPWIGMTYAGSILLAGLAGTFADSLLGSTIQSQFRCPACRAVTGKRIHCNHQPTVLEKGWGFVNNNTVNWVCAGTGAGVMLVLG